VQAGHQEILCDGLSQRIIMPKQPSQAGIALPGGRLPTHAAKLKKGRDTAALFLIFLLPVGLADFIAGDATQERCIRQHTKGRDCHDCVTKKAAPFKGRGQSDREDVTCRGQHPQHPTGMTLAQKG
jgi:hypothetical protein